MKAGRWLAVGALLAAAVLLAFLAHDLRAWSSAFARDDLRAEARAPGPRTWRGDTVLPAGWSEGVLGLEPDRALRLAIQRFRATYARPPGFDGGLGAVKARDAAEAALGEVARDGDARRASQALDLLGLMQFGDSTAGAGSGAATRAVADLQQAIALDPDNAAAKQNLEVVLRLLRTRGARPGSSAAAGPRSTGHHGAGSGTPGEGY
ncbi:MAG TPA: hypothetical protein VHD91_11770 [Gaiellaceae bacterium]|jgi:hypothetical protein|nr:hypothetical protein [Gaiellaceae bacterium]